MKRRLVCLTLAAASFMALVGCSNNQGGSSAAPSTEPTPSSSDSRKVLSVTIDSSETTVKVAESLTLTASVEVEGGASKLVTWSIESGEEFATIGADSGKLEGKFVGTVVVKATSVFDQTKFATKTIEVVDGFNKISEVTQAGTYMVRGVIVAINAKGFLISDKTGTTLVFLNEVPTGYQIGDYVSVSEKLVEGEHQPSNGIWEFTKDAEIKKLETAAPTIDTSATPLTKAIADGWKSITAVNPATDVKKYSWTATCGVSGNFFTLNYAESDTVIEPFYAGADITLEKDHTYNVEGYFINYSTKHSYAAVLFTKAEDTSKVSVSADKTTLAKGETAQITATSKDIEDTTFTYTSSAPEIVAVSDTGLVTAHAQGEATITVKGSHSGAEATIKFTVADNTYKQIKNVSELTSGKEVVIAGLGSDNKTVYSLSTEILKDKTPWYLKADKISTDGISSTISVSNEPSLWKVSQDGESYSFYNEDAGFIKSYVSYVNGTHHSIGLTNVPGTVSSEKGTNDWKVSFDSSGKATFKSSENVYLSFYEKYTQFSGYVKSATLYLFEKEVK